MKEIVLKADNLNVHYDLRSNLFFKPKESLHAVRGINLELKKAEILGIVGESGCGKSSLGKALMRLISIRSGSIFLNNKPFHELKGESLRVLRPRIQMIFQDPYASLDPRMTVHSILEEPLLTHFKMSPPQRLQKIRELLPTVGLSPSVLNKYPHEFSGGQRQRIAIARAIILEPDVIIADEPVSSLDVSVQAQILNLLKDIQRQSGLSMIFISHNLAVVKYISDRIAVMYLGEIVETAKKNELYARAEHPYTQALISAIPIPDPKSERERSRAKLSGEPPSPLKPPTGCSFHTRCPWVVQKCRELTPRLKNLPHSSHEVSCFEVEKKYLIS